MNAVSPSTAVPTQAPAAPLAAPPAAEETQKTPARRDAAHSVVLNQAYEEYLRSSKSDSAFDADAFCGRFPSVQSSLCRLIQVHRFLQGGSKLLAELPEELSWPALGTEFLGFVLQEELGRGAFARVYRAVEPALGNRQVAVKISPQGGAEAETLGRIRHRNIVPVQSVREDPETGLTAVCMTYCGRATLCHVLDHVYGAQRAKPQRAEGILAAVQDEILGPMPAPAVLTKGSFHDGVRFLASQMADALAFIHGQGIVHRDLKPSNVLVSPDGTAMLLDFNLSEDRQAQVTRLGGTLLYMSPEQLAATGEDRRVPQAALDARSDLFSFGVILYELLTGKHPFGPISLNISVEEMRPLLVERQKAGFPPVRKVCPGIDRDLASLVERCLAADPAARPQSAQEAARTLQRGLAPVPRARRWLLRHPGTVLATIVLLAVAGIAGGNILSQREAAYHKLQMESALVAYRAGQFTQAVDHLNRVLEKEPKNARALFTRGRAWQRLGEGDKEHLHLALADFQLAEQLAADGRSLACIGFCLHQLKNVGGAVAHYEKALEKGFSSAALLNNLGSGQIAINKPEEARVHLDKAVALALPLARYNRGVLAINQLQRLKGLENVARVKKDETSLIKVKRERAFWLEQGLKDLRAAVKTTPPSSDLFSHAARMEAFAADNHADAAEMILDCLRQAHVYGANMDSILGENLFSRFRNHPAFLQLRQQPPAPTSVRAVPILDPITDMDL